MNEFIRNFRKQKVVGLLNICSLSLGIMVVIIVGLWSINELNFDSFHKDKDDIYRVTMHIDFNNGRTKSGSLMQQVGKTAKAELPQIESLCRVVFNDGSEMRINERLYTHTVYVSADPNFFSFFTFKLKEGDPNTVLDAPDKVVLSEDAVKRYFPDQDPIGQSLVIDGTTLTVTGIMENMPGNSSIRGDIVTPFFGWQADEANNYSDNFVTFLKIRNSADLPTVSDGVRKALVGDEPMFETVNPVMQLEPLSEIHFSSGFLFDPILKGNKPLVLIFIAVAVVILVLSCINFTNLFVSTSFIRARAIGIKKTQGARKENLIAMFYAETACYVLLAVTIGFLLAYLSLPVFNNFVQSQLVIDPASPLVYGFLIAVFLLTVIVAGTFPAFYLTRFNPIETLSGKFKGKKVSVFQKVLLIIQFTASIALLIVVSYMYRQVEYMISSDLGFDKENVIYIDRRGEFGKNYKQFRDEMLRDPSILDVTRKNSLPMNWMNGNPVGKNRSDNEQIIMEINHVQENYFDFMNIQFLQGENPFYLESADSIGSIVMNLRATEVLGLDNPINESVFVQLQNHVTIKGVINNLKVKSLSSDIHPQVYMKIDDNHWHHVLFFKVTGNPQRAISFIEEQWNKYNPEHPFEYHFLDDTYRQLYNSEMNASKVLGYAMAITLIISIAGLFAMAYYSTQRRIREIGLRKVNGATLKDLLILLNKDFVYWVLIAFALASPVAWFALEKWLGNYTEHISPNIAGFLLIGLIALVVALLTTSFQTWKVANTNPVETLKVEN